MLSTKDSRDRKTVQNKNKITTSVNEWLAINNIVHDNNGGIHIH